MIAATELKESRFRWRGLLAAQLRTQKRAPHMEGQQVQCEIGLLASGLEIRRRGRGLRASAPSHAATVTPAEPLSGRPRAREIGDLGFWFKAPSRGRIVPIRRRGFDDQPWRVQQPQREGERVASRRSLRFGPQSNSGACNRVPRAVEYGR